MPPKTRFESEKVITVALKILISSGWSTVTARSIAKELKSSTMPIYSAIGSMETIEKELKKRAYAILAEYQSRPYTENVLLNMAVGQVLFARDHANLYRFLYIESPVPLTSVEQKALNDEIIRRLGQPLPYDVYFNITKHSMLDAISLMVWIFTHGLAMAVMSGNIGPMDDDEIILRLKDAGGAFYTWEKK